MKSFFSNIDLWLLLQYLIPAGVLGWLGNKAVDWWRAKLQDTATIKVREIDDDAAQRLEFREEKKLLLDKLDKWEQRHDEWIDEKMKLRDEIASLRVKIQLLTMNKEKP